MAHRYPYGRHSGNLALVQATVRTYDPTTRAGTVLLDDGVELPYSADALPRTGLRHLRVGQRVRIDVTDPDGTDDTGGSTRVKALTIYTL